MAVSPMQPRTVAMLTVALALCACGKGDKQANLAALDAQLTTM